MFVIAHISDLHFDGSRLHHARAEAVIDYVNRCADGVDALLVSGDITESGRPEEYAEAARVLQTELPMMLVCGNHDERGAFNAGLLGITGTAPVNSTRRVGEVQFIILDSVVPGRSEGELTDETLAWAAEQLRAAGPDTPVVLAFHHPPAIIGMPYMDTIRLHDADGLGELVAAHPNIVGLLCGHAHSGAVTTFAGRPLVLAPGVASTLNLPFEGTGWVNRGQPPGVAFHLIDDDGRLVTHFRSVTS